jgi:Fe-S cluster assembly ATP-binding protein
VTSRLEIHNLHVRTEDREILRGVDLVVRQGELHALMGPNGSGKSTLANTIMGHPDYEVTEGEILVDGENIIELAPHERAKLGLFLAFQYPVAVPGVTMVNFLRQAINAIRGTEVPIREFRELLFKKMDVLKVDQQFARRYVNDGFSGGEKKRAEMLQMAMLEPSMAVLDETDSGLDIDALRTVAEGVNALMNPEMGLLLITHYQRLLNYVKPQFVHVLIDGRIVRSGGPELAEELEITGYDEMEAALAASATA